MTVTLAVLVNAATFCTFTYLAVIATRSTGFSASVVPALLAMFGLGAFLGVALAGRLADRHWRALIGIGSPLLGAGWLVVGLAPGAPALLWVVAFAQGALSFAIGSTLIARIMAEAESASTMSGAYATAALNLGAIIGPIAGGIALNLLGLHAIALTSAMLASLALVLWWCSASVRQKTTPFDT